MNTTTFKSEFLQILNQRGFIHQATDLEGLDALMARRKISAYIGFDCTAASLHVGSLIQIMILRILQQCGHQPIVLLGGGTTRVGDPSGRDESRQLLNEDSIKQNLRGIQSVLSQFISFKASGSKSASSSVSSNHALIVNNNDWLKDLNYIDFLRDYGRHFSINRMLAFDSVRLRLEREQSLSFLEFNYMILQAYDFLKLNKEHDCVLQIGGSDQWGNIVNGVELNRRFTAAQSSQLARNSQSTADNSASSNSESKELYGLTTPLLTTANGAKMGKTADGAIWLNKDLLSPFDYYQYFRNTDDRDVGRFLRLFTELPISEIEKLERLKDQEINHAKKILAFETAKICHGEQAAQEAQQTAQNTFENQHNANSIENLITHKITLTQEEQQNGKPLFLILRETGLCASGGEAKRLIKGGAIKIDDNKIADENHSLKPQNFTQTAKDGSKQLKLSAGKKKHIRIIFDME